MQNATQEQMKMLLTRIGDGSKLIVTGDLNQHDRGFTSNGLADFIDRLKQFSSDRINLIEFDHSLSLQLFVQMGKPRMRHQISVE
jgi:phosphate starvation-inducible PhoH-like protein